MTVRRILKEPELKKIFLKIFVLLHSFPCRSFTGAYRDYNTPYGCKKEGDTWRSCNGDGKAWVRHKASG